MLTFDANGYLTPYVPIVADLATVEQTFVEAFPTSTTRRPHFNRYLDYNTRLSEFLPTGLTQWIDGSFVSRKLNPNDIDVLTFVEYTLYDRHEKELRELKREFVTRVEGRVDAHLIVVYPEGHRRRIYYESDRIQWLFDWSRTARPPRRNKGFIELKTT
jgi:hypothetical protein